MPTYAFREVPPLFLVGEHPTGAFYVYPYTNAPDPETLGPGALIPTREAANEYASRMNAASDRYAEDIFQQAVGALVSDLCTFASIPGSPESDESRHWLMALSRAMLEQPPAVALCVHFQGRLRQAELQGMGEERIRRFLQEAGLAGPKFGRRSGELSPN